MLQPSNGKKRIDKDISDGESERGALRVPNDARGIIAYACEGPQVNNNQPGTMYYLMVGAFASHDYRRQQTAFAELQGRRGWRVVPLCFSIRPRSRGRFRLEMHFECSSLRTTKRESDEDIRR